MDEAFFISIIGVFLNYKLFGMKILKKIGKWFLIILVILNIAILVSGKTYLYKGIANTYLKGRPGPSIDEYQIFENREVKAGNYLAWKKSTRYNSSKIPATLEKNFTDLGTVAYVIIKNDSIIHEQYWDGYDADSHSNSFSMAKTFVGILIGAAIDEGKIKSLDQPIGDFFPQFKEGKNANITIKHLLTMSSGINFDEDYVNPLAYPAQAYYGSEIKELTLGYEAQDEPGKTFKYLSGNSELLGMIIEKVTGKTLSEYMSEKLWKPLGAKNAAQWSLDHKDGMEKAYCCFNANAPDFARIGQLYLDSGKWNGNQLINQEFVMNSIIPADLADEGGRNQRYGYAWWLIPDYKMKNIFYARGILGQYILCIPDKKMVVVRLGKKREKPTGNETPKDVMYYLDAALEMYGN
ncbi:MAG: serine hydrolase [Bacteroidetes bacterium]|nr:serine hydrolase [Bacteroidota bacterium]